MSMKFLFLICFKNQRRLSTQPKTFIYKNFNCHSFKKMYLYRPYKHYVSLRNLFSTTYSHLNKIGGYFRVGLLVSKVNRQNGFTGFFGQKIETVSVPPSRSKAQALQKSFLPSIL